MTYLQLVFSNAIMDAKSWNDDYAAKILGRTKSDIPKMRAVEEMVEVKSEGELN